MDRPLLFLWNWLRLDASLDLAVHEVLHELANVLGSELLSLGEGELEVLDGFLDGKCRELVRLEVEVTGVSTKGLGVNGRKIDLAPVFLGYRSKGVREFRSLLGRLREDVGEGNTSLIEWINHDSLYHRYDKHLRPCNRNRSPDQPLQSREPKHS